MTKRPKLEIYFAERCKGSAVAVRTAKLLRKKMPLVEVNLIDLAQKEVTVPEDVFSVPTYRLDGKVISIGNPDKAQILDLVRTAVVAPRS